MTQLPQILKSSQPHKDVSNSIYHTTNWVFVFFFPVFRSSDFESRRHPIWFVHRANSKYNKYIIKWPTFSIQNNHNPCNHKFIIHFTQFLVHMLLNQISKRHFFLGSTDFKSMWSFLFARNTICINLKIWSSTFKTSIQTKSEPLL